MTPSDEARGVAELVATSTVEEVAEEQNYNDCKLLILVSLFYSHD
jgi:hypothetical protein